ncbi:hypothetical protein [Angustibacter luteus]|uniref:Uncharacterized protein n=1 Tax=Angustibacter luteus TaxID=658456 RepID=A0ABW1JFJ0_9ACTN
MTSATSGPPDAPSGVFAGALRELDAGGAARSGTCPMGRSQRP